jgi:hypothetical protein
VQDLASEETRSQGKGETYGGGAPQGFHGGQLQIVLRQRPGHATIGVRVWVRL